MDAKTPMKVFICYSRSDTDVTDQVVQRLISEGFEVLIDRRNLPFGRKWLDELGGLIEQSDTIIWMVSDASINSRWCRWELGQTTAMSKRLVPVRLEDIDPDTIPEKLGEVHFLPAEGTFAVADHLDALTETLETDHDWIKEHSRLTELARQWDPDKGTGRLLRGEALKWAENVQATRPEKAPALGARVLDFILESNRLRIRRQLWWISGSVAVASFALVLAAISVFLFFEAREQRDVAELRRQEADLQRAEAERQRAEAVRLQNVAEEQQQRAEHALLEERLAATERSIEESGRLAAAGHYQKAGRAAHDALSGLEELKPRDIEQNRRTEAARGRLLGLLARSTYADKEVARILLNLEEGDEIRSMLFSPDGDRLAVETEIDGLNRVTLYEMPSAIRQRQISGVADYPGPDGRSFGFRPNGTFVAVLETGRILTVSAGNERERYSLNSDGHVTFAALSNDASMLITGHYEDGILISSVSDPDSSIRLPLPAEAAIPGREEIIGWSRDARHVVLPSLKDGNEDWLERVDVWHQSGEMAGSLKVDSSRSGQFLFDHDGQFALAANRGGIEFLRLADGQLLKAAVTLESTTEVVGFSSSASRIVLRSLGAASNLMTFPGFEEIEISGSRYMRQVNFDQRTSLGTIDDSGSFGAYDTETGAEFFRHTAWDIPIAGRPFMAAGNDRVFAATQDGFLRIWDMGAGAQIATLPFPDVAEGRVAAVDPAGRYLAVAQSFDDRQFANGGLRSLAVRIYAPERMKKLPGTSSLVVNGDGSAVMVEPVGSPAMLFDVMTEQATDFGARWGAKVAAETDGRRFAVAWAGIGAPQIIDPRQPLKPALLQVGGDHAASFRAAIGSAEPDWLRFDGRSQTILSGYRGISAVGVWDTETGNPVSVLEGMGRPQAVAFGTSRITISFLDGTVATYDRQSGHRIFGPLQLDERIQDAWYDGAGRLVAKMLNGGPRRYDPENFEKIEWPAEFTDALIALGGRSRDGNRLSLVLTWEGKQKVAILDSAENKVTFDIEPELMVSRLALSPSGKFLAYALTDGTTRLIDVSSGRRISSVRTHEANPFADLFLSFPNEKLLAAYRQSAPRARFIATETGFEIGAEAAAAIVPQMLPRFSDDGSTMLLVHGDKFTFGQLDHFLLRSDLAARIAEAPAETYLQRRFDPPVVRTKVFDEPDECDLQATNRFDPERNWSGVDFGNIDPALAIESCQRVVAENPGNGRALYQLARSLHAADQTGKAMDAYRRAFDLGHAMAAFGLADLLLNENDDAGIQLLEDAHLMGVAIANNRLFEAYWFGDAVDRDREKALEYLRRGVLASDPIAAERMGHFLESGRRIKRDLSAALDNYALAETEYARVGDTESAAAAAARRASIARNLPVSAQVAGSSFD